MGCVMSALCFGFGVFFPTLFIKSWWFCFLGLNTLHKGREQGANSVAGAGSCWEKLSQVWSLCRDPSPEISFCHWKRHLCAEWGVALVFGTAGGNSSSAQNSFELRQMAQMLLGFAGDPVQASRTDIALVPLLNTVWSMNELFSPFFWLSTSEFLALVCADG